jgi:hypothetical protein
MATITENLQTIVDCKIAIKQAIIDKGGEVGDLTTYADAIANLPSGGGDTNPTAEKNAVTFYDYDGTIRYSYTAEEFLALTEMPPLPKQKGLICQEWNWSYEDAIEYVAEYGVLDVGATYITDDGKTRLYIRIAAEGRMDVPLYFRQTIANGVTIDWGDGSATETLSGTDKVNTTHHYNSIGDYMISLDVAEGCTLTLGHSTSSYCVMGSNSNNGKVYCSMLQKVEIGKNVTTIGGYAFQYCYSLKSVTIPSRCTIWGACVFQYDESLISIIIPSGVTSVPLNLANGCYSLTTIVMPNSVTSLVDSAIRQCYSLSSIVIPRITSIKNYVFQDNHSLSSIAIPNSITQIGLQMFLNCFSLSSIAIPPSVTSIQTSAFNNCYGMAFYDFSHHTAVPTLENTNAFTGIPSDCKIIVPDSLYDTWIAATNWSTYASYIIKKTDWDNL